MRDQISAFSVDGFRLRAETALARDADPALHPDEQEPIKDLAWHEGEVLHLKDAAVLIPIVDRGGEAMVILTHRTQHLPSHAGQIAFPGGKVDEADGTAERAALREADEEIGLKADYVDVIGQMRPYVSSTGYRIFPVLSVVREGFELSRNPGEVDEIFEVPLRFCDGSGQPSTQKC